MKIAPDVVVAFDYVLTDDAGTVIDRGSGDEAMTYLHGHSQILPGLERALDGKSVGDELKIVLAPADGYGEKGEQDEIKAPRSEFPEDMDLEPGAELQGEGDDGTADTFWVVEVDDEWVTLTSDHPLAGITLHFDVKVRDLRAATADELEHGHAHDGDEHHHH